ncbi:MAG: hypothetical protein IJ723_05755 [Ruminococcus sp.]|nr:hypothetical protein [Ruminococcus sp.]
MKKSLAAACFMTALIMLSASGCGSSGSKGAAKTTTARQTAETEKDTETETEAASEKEGSESEAPVTVLGEGLEKTCQLFGGDYTYSVKTTFSDAPEEETATVVAKQGDIVYITYTDKGSKKPDRAYYFDGTAAYDIDYGLKIYSAREEWTDYNLILSLVDKSPENTEAHSTETQEGYTTEQYTYAGDTYITVFDFYFDEDKNLKEYTVTYTVEGEDDIVQSCTVESLEQTAKAPKEPLKELTDFDGMSEDQRLGFCQGICGEREISTDNMYEMNITTDDLKRIDYETFTELVYTYGK